jgi:protein tyrosine phosphatase (PTP) superfamily phosphohydrolase (DUF442 family)
MRTLGAHDDETAQPRRVNDRSPAARRMRSAVAACVLLAFGALVGALVYAYAPELMRTSSTEAPANFVAVSDRIDTSGQPSEAQLSGLKKKGYGLVINLAPPAAVTSIATEGLLVGETGVSYVSIPVDWHAPQYEDFALFSDILTHAGSRRTLVHCQINKRASLFAFLYRVVYEGVAPDAAYEKVTAIGVPDEQWKEFARAVLKRHKIDYEFY